jgi:hypothetical protein
VTAEVNVPDEAVHAAFSGGWSDTLTSVEMRQVLANAAPLIVATELERLANQIWQEHDPDAQDDESYTEGVDDTIVAIRDRAAELRGESR